ncbi:TRAP transporter small permease subunit [Rhizobiales bacterium]|uniref:TRAP transporter small permease subunit n=1 Tax=Hongsoonwoonella zoysiae TaxID=2821844 RepID=UPI0015607EDE|nr:TRAP transporter small permease subunit [Hongsoonwoonella zoysiae]NRG17280.1 TRAP transporter small permease subunit [Hongsoonwoonella zoysiae]
MLIRLFSWMMLAVLAAFLVNNYLNFWQGFPGAGAAFGAQAHGGASPALAWLQVGLYVLGIALAALYVMRSKDTPLRADSKRITDMNTFIIRAAFWAVVIVGLADMTIAFLRVEGLLEHYFGHQLASDLGRSQFRGPYVHMPLIAVSIVIAAFTRTLGFPWLALLVVVAELLIVVGRFIFSYEQAFMADLVRFWYAALFLFASAYTLLEEGHVRVDVFYSGFSSKLKGYVNALGSIFLGMTFCWTILIIGMAGRNNIINSPLLSYEVTQSGFGLFVKYLMAGFLAVFAATMLIQFVSYLLDAVADIREEPGGRDHEAPHIS